MLAHKTDVSKFKRIDFIQSTFSDNNGMQTEIWDVEIKQLTLK